MRRTVAREGLEALVARLVRLNEQHEFGSTGQYHKAKPKQLNGALKPTVE
jgi:hypothetical protein